MRKFRKWEEERAVTSKWQACGGSPGHSWGWPQELSVLHCWGEGGRSRRENPDRSVGNITVGQSRETERVLRPRERGDRSMAAGSRTSL